MRLRADKEYGIRLILFANQAICLLFGCLALGSVQFERELPELRAISRYVRLSQQDIGIQG